MQRPLYFQNEDQLIAGTFHSPNDLTEPVPGILLCHGFTGHKAEAHFIFTKLSRALERAGLASLRFDFRGSGESEGEFQEMTVSREVSDARRALAVLREQQEIDVNRLGVLGLSLGGCVAAHVAGLEKNVKACVLWSAVANLVETVGRIQQEQPSRPRTPEGGWDLGGLHLGQGFVDELPDVDPVKHLRHSSAAVLILHGDADTVVPSDHAERFYLAARSAGLISEKFILPGADHVFSSLAWEHAVIDKTVGWLKQHL